MTFALCLQVPNHFKFNRKSDLYTNFIPQVLFLQSIFGYLVLCILYKWSVDWSKSDTAPPSLLNMLIAMVLQPGQVAPDKQLYPGQATVQTVLLAIAGVCVPWLLISKPYLAWKAMQETHHQGYVTLGNEDHGRHSTDDTLEGEEEGNGRAIVEAAEEEHVGFDSSHFRTDSEPDFNFQEEHDFGDVVIHQVIHTIEFCLGCISHTASYLRLWALSLAHAQLSAVLWDMTIGGFTNPKSIGGWIALLLVGAMWLNLTIGILCVMEVRGAIASRRQPLALGLRIWADCVSFFFNPGSFGVFACAPSSLG